MATMAGQAIDGWRARGLAGTVPTSRGGEMPAAMAASIMSVEFLLHAWDLAQASGQALVAGVGLVAYVHHLAEQVMPGARGSAFGDEVAPSADADPMARLAAFSGRRSVAA